MRLSRQLTLAAALAVAASPIPAADITLLGDWSEVINAGDLVAGAGSDLRTPIDSGGTQARIDIVSTGGAGWVVRVRRADNHWPTGGILLAQRTTDGSGVGSISGGGTWTAISGSDRVLFSGTGGRVSIGVQLRLEGLSVQHDPHSYATTMTYSVQ